MIGVIDSGEGGMNAVRYLEQRTDEDILFFPDRKNAPYGTKSREELTLLLSRGIDRLTALGADRILIACCTAGTVHHLLDEERMGISFPILYPTALAAVKGTLSGKIALIATDATVNSLAFDKEIERAAKELGKKCTLFGVKAQALVSIVEKTAAGKAFSKEDYERIEKTVRSVKGNGIDTLILGCTHFESLENIIAPIVRSFGINNIVSSAKEGARSFLTDKKPNKPINKRRIFLSERG